MSSPNEKFRRRAAKTDISNLFDDLPELDEEEKSESISSKESQSPPSSSEPKKVIKIDTTDSELFDDLPPIEIEDGRIKDLSADNTQLSAFARDGKGDIGLTPEELNAIASSGDSDDEKKKKLAQIMAKRKNRKKERKEDDGMFDLDDLDIDE